MSTEICGHDRYDLRIVLNVQSVLDREGPRFVPGNAQQLRAHMAICEPDKLVEIAAELLTSIGCSVYVFRRSMFAQGCPRAQFVFLYEPGEDTIDIWDGKTWHNHRSMQQARAFVLKLLDSPSEQDTV